MDFSAYTSKEIEEIFREFQTPPDLGLNEEEVFKRQKEFGLNEITGEELSWWQILVRQFKSSFVYLLFVACLIAFFLQETINGLMILLFIFINASIGFFQEYRSENTLKLLKKYLIQKAKVLRGGEKQAIPAKDLVPGDLVFVQAGDLIPADLRLFKEHNLMVDESTLTGESAPVKKTAQKLKEKVPQVHLAQNIGFAGTTVVAGKGEGMVFSIGKKTVLGEVARLTVETTKVSSFEKSLKSLSNFVLRLVLVTLAFVFLANILLKSGKAEFSQLALFSLALAVSVVPEALPLVTTFSLSRGALRLAKNKVVVKRLSAIEDLGGIEILCVDKTGTLTENILKVAEVFPKDSREILFYAGLGSTTLAEKKTPQSAFDQAIWRTLSYEEKQKLQSLPEAVNTVPFDPERRRESVLAKIDDHYQLIVRGAPEMILDSSNLTPQERKKAEKWLIAEGEKGCRTLGLGKKKVTFENHYEFCEEEKDLDFLGFVSFIDPIKETTKEAIQKAQNLGVKIKILTGDTKEVAGAVAYQVGLVSSPKKVISGEEFEKLSPEKKHQALEEYSVFARVTPRQKYEIVQMFEKSSETGFLGEGINDAPALKIANIAMVVQGASDIAQEASDIVLLRKSLKVIIDGIREGREVFANTIKYLKVTLASNFGNFYAIAIASLLIDFLPLLPLQILLVNLLSDFPMIAIATDSVAQEEIKKPQKYDLKNITLLATILGLVSSIFDFMFFAYFVKIGAGVLQTMWFMGSILTELIFIYSIRTRLFFLKSRRPSFPLFFLSIAASLATILLPFTFFGQKVFQFIKPTFGQLSTAFLIIGLYFLVTELVKLFYFRFSNQNQ